MRIARSTRPKTLLSGLAALLLLTGAAAAQVQDTSFTYQGRLDQSGNPADGLFDFDFSLFSAEVGGALLGHVQKFDATVSDGLFSAPLDFGTSALTGQPIWIEVRVRPAGSGLFTVLPRQPLTATPYSLYSSSANSADNADFLDGLDSTAFLRTAGGSMAGHIVFNDTLGIRSQGGAKIETGVHGGTFQFHPGTHPGAAIAIFKDVQGNQKVMVDEAGLVRFISGQKMCRIFPDGIDPWNNTLLVSGGWSAANCQALRDVILGPGNGTYQLWCMFDTTFSFGSPNGGIPSPNCGW